MPAMAEMLATMYDASLDKIWKDTQNLKLIYNLSLPIARWMDGYWGMNSYNYWFPYKSLKVLPMTYDRFIIPGAAGMIPETEIYTYGSTVARGVRVRGLAKAEANAPMMSMVSKEAASDKADVVFTEELAEGAAGENLPEATEELRTNFAETAFFIRNFGPMSRAKSLSHLLCHKALPAGTSVDMPIPKAC